MGPQQTSRVRMSPSPTELQSRSPKTFPASLNNGLEGVELTIEALPRRKHYTRLPFTETLKVMGRQVSKCSQLTMEGLVSETSFSSKDSQIYGEPFTSDDELSTTNSQLSSDTSTDSQDSGIKVAAAKPSAGQYQSFQRTTGSDCPSRASLSQSGCPEMDNSAALAFWKWSDSRRQQIFSDEKARHHLSSSRFMKKKRKQNHHGVYSGTGRPSRSAAGSLLFPLQHLTDSFKSADQGESHHGHSSNRKLAETSLLLEFSEELKEIVIVAGKSSERLVSSLFHQLCEE
jgi:hypothetical protein